MLGLMGGTFNPIHRGHIRLALEVRRRFFLQRVELLPSHISVHRQQPGINARLRRKMVELAVAEHSGSLMVNTIELERNGPSYSYETLTELKQRQPHETLCWLMGSDSFNTFTSWKNPQGILQLANLIVCSRPGYEVDQTIFPQHHLAETESLQDFASGKIVFHQMSPDPCSSSAIRQHLQQHESVGDCLAPSVLNFIQQNRLYES